MMEFQSRAPNYSRVSSTDSQASISSCDSIGEVINRRPKSNAIKMRNKTYEEAEAQRNRNNYNERRRHCEKVDTVTKIRLLLPAALRQGDKRMSRQAVIRAAIKYIESLNPERRQEIPLESIKEKKIIERLRQVLPEVYSKKTEIQVLKSTVQYLTLLSSQRNGQQSKRRDDQDVKIDNVNFDFLKDIPLDDLLDVYDVAPSNRENNFGVKDHNLSPGGLTSDAETATIFEHDLHLDHLMETPYYTNPYQEYSHPVYGGEVLESEVDLWDLV